MEAPLSFDAVVLCGGDSRRMGTDKAFLELGGKTFLERALRAVDGANRVIPVGPQRGVGDTRCIWTRENPPGGGPVAGVAAGLSHVTAEWVVVLAVDHPLVDSHAITRLLAAAGEREGAVVVDAEGKEQPLVGVYRAASLRARIELLEAVEGAAITTLVSDLDLARVEDERAGRDFDSPGDLVPFDRDHSIADR